MEFFLKVLLMGMLLSSISDQDKLLSSTETVTRGQYHYY